VICESAGLGKGTKFTVSLPLLPTEEKRTEEQASNESMLLSIAPSRKLVFDDNADAASVLSMLLEAEDHEVMIENGSHRL
jgi:hypothetical protein